MSKGRRSPCPRFLPTRWLSRVAAALVASGLAASQAAASEWPQRTVQPNGKPDLADGRLYIAEMPLASVNDIARSGSIRMLAVTNARHAPAPEIPTVRQSGYLQFAFGGTFGPEDMPAELRERIAADVRGALAEPAPANIGMAAHGTAPVEFSAILDEQRAKWAAIAHDHGIKPVH